MLNFAYVIGNFGIFYCNATINTFFLIIFKSAGFHNPAALLGIGWIIGAMLQPLTGILSDVYIKYGRKPFILAGVLACAFSLALLYQQKGYFIYNIILFYIGLHIYQIPLNALIPDQVGAERLQEISGLWNLSGALGSVTAPLLGVVLLKQGYIYIFLGLFIIITASAAVPLLFIRENRHIQIKHDLWRVLTDYMTSKYIEKFYAAKLLWWMGLGCYLPFIVYNLMNRGLSAGASGMIYTSFMAVNCIASIFLSKFKIKDCRYALSNAIIGVGLCTITMYINKNIDLTILFILMTGVMYGIIMICSYKIMIEMIPREEGGMYLGMDNVFLNIPQALSAFLVAAVSNINNNMHLVFSSLFMSISYIYILYAWNKS